MPRGATPDSSPVIDRSGPGLDGLHETVFAWITPRLRQLPWRDTRDPWHVLVSEVMLQQTGVNRVLPKWEAFVEAFPTPSHCARTPLGEVLRLWQGLGYPRRARNLHEAAKRIVDDHGGVVPATLDDLLSLPGVGPYTAGAIASIALGHVEPILDGNVERRNWLVTDQQVRPKRQGARDTNSLALSTGEAVRVATHGVFHSGCKVA